MVVVPNKRLDELGIAMSLQWVFRNNDSDWRRPILTDFFIF